MIRKVLQVPGKSFNHDRNEPTECIQTVWSFHFISFYFSLAYKNMYHKLIGYLIRHLIHFKSSAAEVYLILALPSICMLTWV